jgi:hypothetical protein
VPWLKVVDEAEERRSRLVVEMTAARQLDRSNRRLERKKAALALSGTALTVGDTFEAAEDSQRCW